MIIYVVNVVKVAPFGSFHLVQFVDARVEQTCAQDHVHEVLIFHVIVNVYLVDVVEQQEHVGEVHHTPDHVELGSERLPFEVQDVNDGL